MHIYHALINPLSNQRHEHNMVQWYIINLMRVSRFGLVVRLVSGRA